MKFFALVLIIAFCSVVVALADRPATAAWESNAPDGLNVEYRLYSIDAAGERTLVTATAEKSAPIILPNGMSQYVVTAIYQGFESADSNQVNVFVPTAPVLVIAPQ